MEKDFSGNLTVDKQVIKNSIEQQIPFEITTYTLPRYMETYIREVLTEFLNQCGQGSLFSYFDYCLGELLANAKKANTKRIYFKERNLDIESIQDYEEGIKNFKDDTYAKLDYYLDLQETAGLYIKLSILFKDDVLTLDIRNNSVLTEIEKQRVKERLDNIHQYTMEELLGNVVDQTEGAGLGINSVGLMLQKIGLPKENFSIFVEGDETVSRIEYPCQIMELTDSDLLEEI